MKSEKTNKLALRAEKRSSFKTKRGIKTRRHRFVEKLPGNNLAKFQPNWSIGCRLVVLKNVRTTRQNLTFEKCVFCGVLPVMRFRHLNVRWVLFWSIPERDQLSQTIELWQVTCNRSNLERRAAENNLLAFNSPLLDVREHSSFSFYLPNGFLISIRISCNNENVLWIFPEMLTRLIKMPKIAAKSGEIVDAATSPVDKMNLDSSPFFSFILGLEDEITHNCFLNDDLGERKLSLLRKKNFYKPFRKKRFRFHVIKLIRCDRTCQRSIIIINKEKSFTPNNSPLSHYSPPCFCLKESSRRDLSEHVKISLMKKWHFFPWLIPQGGEAFYSC